MPLPRCRIPILTVAGLIEIAALHRLQLTEFEAADGRETVLSVAAQQSSICCDCRVGRRPASVSLAFKRDATAVAFDVHLEDGSVMNEAVDDSDPHCLVTEHSTMPQ